MATTTRGLPSGAAICQLGRLEDDGALQRAGVQDRLGHVGQASCQATITATAAATMPPNASQPASWSIEKLSTNSVAPWMRLFLPVTAGPRARQ
jgi:hypothetical protein